MPKTSTPMTLDAMRSFALAQVAHYQDLLTMIDKIQADPISVMAQAATPVKRRPAKRRPAKRRPAKRRPGLGPAAIHEAARATAAPTHTAAQAYAKAAVLKLGVATTQEVVAFALKKGWGTISKTPDVVMHIELQKMLKKKILRRVKHEGREVRWAMATPSKAAAKKLADAVAALNGRPPVVATEAVN